MTRRAIRVILEIVGLAFFWVMIDSMILITIAIVVWLFFGAKLVSLIYVEPFIEGNNETEEGDDESKNN